MISLMTETIEVDDNTLNRLGELAKKRGLSLEAMCEQVLETFASIESVMSKPREEGDVLDVSAVALGAHRTLLIVREPYVDVEDFLE